MIKYFHQTTPEEKFEIYNRRMKMSCISKTYPKPSWCNNKQALDGLFGCQDLWTGFIKNEIDCETCADFKRDQK